MSRSKDTSSQSSSRSSKKKLTGKQLDMIDKQMELINKQMNDNDLNINSDTENENTENNPENNNGLVISEEFKENVIKYVKIDDIIKIKEEEIRELKKQRKPCEEKILEYLESSGENVIDITRGKLRKNKSETKAPMTRDIIKAAIMEKIQDISIVESILKRMEELRPLKTNINLKRTSARDKT
jgi:hypothetical protein